MKINRSERNRVYVLFAGFSIWILFIIAALVKIQIFNYNKYLLKIKAQSNRVFSLHPKRGTIYDCNGEILAISVKAKSAFLSNKNRSESLNLYSIIRKKIGLTYREKQDIKKRIKRGDKFIWIKRKLSENEYLRLKRLKFDPRYKSHLDFIEEYKRMYPQNVSASHILGGVGIDEQGLSGIEYELDSVIMGKGGKVEVELDARKKIFKYNYLTHPVFGKDIHLTIDSSVQFFVEKELMKTVKKYKAKGGAVIIMDSRDGAILAMASYPHYKPDRIKYASYRVLKNRAVSFLFDPGSTFKIVLASSALENKICYPQQVYNCYNGVFQLRNRKILDHKPFDRLTFEEILVHSSNIGAARIGLRLGKKRFFKKIKEFGFGDKTGIKLPSEEKGILNPLKKWTDVSSAYIAFGYEIVVTPLQMTRAFNVVASGGYLVQPHILKKIGGSLCRKGEKVKILSQSTNHRLASIMADVVKVGTGKKAKIKGIDIAGKTGTAKKIKKGEYKDIYVSSFGGFFPVQNPRITMFVVIDEPVGEYYGGDVAAPLFRSIAERLLIYFNIFPELDNKNEIRI